MNRTADVAIVGFGIAGATLAHTLLARGVSVVVFESPCHPAVSRSAGTISPVAGLRFGVIGNWQQWWASAWDFYRRYQAIGELPCYRLLYRDDECRFWERKRADLVLAELAKEVPLPPKLADILVAPIKTVEICYAARVAAASLLDTLCVDLERNGQYIRQTINEHDLRYHGHTWNVACVRCRNVVFCEGAWLRTDGLFGWVPRMFARGQRIMGTLDAVDGLSPVWLSIRGKSLVIEGQYFLYGSTYDWSCAEPVVTEDATQHLANELGKILGCQYTVERVWAGVRPIVADLWPVIGEHPERRGLWIFNGLGSRGLLLAPYLAQLLAEAIVSGCSIPPQWDVLRFA